MEEGVEGGKRRRSEEVEKSRKPADMRKIQYTIYIYIIKPTGWQGYISRDMCAQSSIQCPESDIYLWNYADAAPTVSERCG